MYVCMYVCMHVCIHYVTLRVSVFKICSPGIRSRQEFIIALMMGMHARLGAESPLLLLDPFLVKNIADQVIADKWSVHL